MDMMRIFRSNSLAGALTASIQLFATPRFSAQSVLRDNLMLPILGAFSAFIGFSTTPVRGHLLRLEWSLVFPPRTNSLEFRRLSASIMQLCHKYMRSDGGSPRRMPGDDSDGKSSGENGVPICPIKNSGFLPLRFEMLKSIHILNIIYGREMRLDLHETKRF
jgi:hypothetical protein